MVWVRSEYAGELAVLFAWAGALLPWSVSFASRDGLSLVVVRFPLFLVQFVFGADLGAAERPLRPVWTAPRIAGGGVAEAYWVWVAGAALIGLAVLLSVVYYAREAQVEAGPLDPVRTMGALLGGAAVVLSASTYLLAARFPGGALPVGVLLLYAFGGLLLTVDRR